MGLQIKCARASEEYFILKKRPPSPPTPSRKKVVWVEIRRESFKNTKITLHLVNITNHFLFLRFTYPQHFVLKYLQPTWRWSVFTVRYGPNI